MIFPWHTLGFLVSSEYHLETTNLNFVTYQKVQLGFLNVTMSLLYSNDLHTPTEHCWDVVEMLSAILFFLIFFLSYHDFTAHNQIVSSI